MWRIGPWRVEMKNFGCVKMGGRSKNLMLLFPLWQMSDLKKGSHNSEPMFAEVKDNTHGQSVFEHKWFAKKSCVKVEWNSFHHHCTAESLAIKSRCGDRSFQTMCCTSHVHHCTSHQSFCNHSKSQMQTWLMLHCNVKWLQLWSQWRIDSIAIFTQLMTSKAWWNEAENQMCGCARCTPVVNDSINKRDQNSWDEKTNVELNVKQFTVILKSKIEAKAWCEWGKSLMWKAWNGQMIRVIERMNFC